MRWAADSGGGLQGLPGCAVIIVIEQRREVEEYGGIEPRREAKGKQRESRGLFAIRAAFNGFH